MNEEMKDRVRMQETPEGPEIQITFRPAEVELLLKLVTGLESGIAASIGSPLAKERLHEISIEALIGHLERETKLARLLQHAMSRASKALEER